MLEGKGRCAQIGHSIAIRLPIYVAKDSRFPFKLDEIVHVKIEKGKVIIEKLPTESEQLP